MRLVYLSFLTMVFLSCSIVEQKTEVVQVSSVSEKTEQHWKQMISGLKLETEQALHLAMMRVGNNKSGAILPDFGQGLIINGEDLLVPGQGIEWNASKAAVDWEIMLGLSEFGRPLDKNKIDLFVFCIRDEICPIVFEKMVSLGVNIPRLKVVHTEGENFKGELETWIKGHPNFLIVGENMLDFKKLFKKIRISSDLTRKLDQYFVALPNTRSRISNWHAKQER